MSVILGGWVLKLTIKIINEEVPQNDLQASTGGGGGEGNQTIPRGSRSRRISQVSAVSMPAKHLGKLRLRSPDIPELHPKATT